MSREKGVIFTRRRMRCSKCGRAPARVCEPAPGYTPWLATKQDDGTIMLESEAPVGHHGGQCWAECACGHVWDLRGITSIEHLLPRWTS